ncbi:GNAT family N-acetyltransferase [Marivita geojedonensis]|uniref:Acetyltransferase n=1 Tax=Marivita geojedonensis TaxID=1123756 RepID=A0A1X4NPN1_9RHOB|nr:GNAT family N-acetyltransferase [Marivita geojedonensis]OSQ52690.1 acetyltransferase [Marivita geojedonensis]PRY80909.1 acetyltransferase (GNAT) family protein [Marivita geojedonensis]
MSNISCRTASQSEVAQMLNWAADEGWNPGLDDAEAFFAADPAGFFVAETAEKIVAAISVVNHSDSFSFLGLYLCLPEYRGRGIGYALWQHAIAHAGERVIGLDGVPEQESNYAKSGFVLADRTRRLTGSISKEDLVLPLATQEEFAALANLDEVANGVARTDFLRSWLKSAPTRKTVVLKENGMITGFATARLCRSNCKIGPVIAPDANTALHLVHQAAAALDCSTVIIDVPDSSIAFGDILRKKGFTESFATARMYRGAGPQAVDTLHAVATLELG